MRNAWIKTLIKEAEKNPNIFLIVGDLGFGVIEEFQKRFPNQFINAGIAEQNMTSIAAGLAMSGKIVFTYSISNFPTLRALEQIRNDICYHNANVKIISYGAGFHYCSLGPTHHATEDIAALRSIPNITILSPCDGIETELATYEIIKHKGPCYMRLSKSKEVHKTKPVFKIGKSIKIKEGKDITIIATGDMLYDAVCISKILEKNKISARIISMHTIKPIDTQEIQRAKKETKAIFTIENHQITGGLGSAVAEALFNNTKNGILFKRFGIKDIFIKEIGSIEYIKEKNNLLPEQIAKEIIKTLS